MKGLTEGRIVHFVMNEGRYQGEHRPAIVVKVWDREANGNGCCQLVVFIDGTNDLPTETGLTRWKTSVLFDDGEKKPGTWHWIEQA